MMIVRSFDYRRINRMMGDGWKPIVSKNVIYLIENNDGEDLGIIIFEPWEDGLLMHGSVEKKWRGRRAIKSAKEALGWIFENTEFDRIYTASHLKHKAAQAMVSLMGMEWIRTTETHKFYWVAK